MKRTQQPLSIVLIALFVGSALVVAYLASNRGLPKMPEKMPPMEVYFSPKGGCTEATVREIDAAKSTILVQAYSFTSKPTAEALVAACKRGVKINVILDRSQETENYSEADFLIHEGIPPLIDDRHAIAHNKVMVIDDGVVVTGSFNFTTSAENSNAENLLIIRDGDLANRYTDNWNAHAAHSRAYEEKTKKDRDSQSERKPAKPRRGNSKDVEKGLKKAMQSLWN